MACVREQELYCNKCGNIKEFPFCCGKTMEYDNLIFFCNICDREKQNDYKCCKQQMIVRNKIINIKKEIFGNP